MAKAQLLGIGDVLKALDEFRPATQRNVLKRVGKEALQTMAETARSLAPTDSVHGETHLRDSIIVADHRSGHPVQTHQSEFGVTVFMGPNANGYPEAMIQEFGAPPHRIVPKKKGGKKALAFDVGETHVVAAGVDHPGNAPHPFMRPAFERDQAEVFAAVGHQLGVEVEKTAARLRARALKRASKA